MKLVKHLARLGYGSRKEVQRQIRRGAATDAEGNPLGNADLIPHGEIRFLGEELDPPQFLTIILNKPTGYVCSTEDVPDTVYDLLPYRFLRRNPVLSCVGRLDKDTSGMLLLTDDGKLLHKLIHPKQKVGKVYDVVLDRPLNGDEGELFASGEMLLKDDAKPLKPGVLEVLGEKHVRLTLQEGRYHQVRRMFAATGNHVLELKRVAMGGLLLPEDIAEGEWRAITDEELELVLEG